MTYTAELDGLRQEIRVSTAGSLTFYPKRSGTGNVTATAATYRILDPSGNEIQSSASATISTITVTCPVSSIGTLDEDYLCEISWAQSNYSTVEPILFDVVLFPLNPGAISLNDFLSERPDAEEILTRHGALLSKTAEQMASLYSHRAYIELDRMIRDAIPTYASAGLGRPHLVLNRERLVPVARKLAMRVMYSSEMRNPDGEDESAGLFRYYRSEVESLFRSVGPLKFQNPTATTPAVTGEIESPARYRILRRG